MISRKNILNYISKLLSADGGKKPSWRYVCTFSLWIYEFQELLENKKRKEIPFLRAILLVCTFLFISLEVQCLRTKFRLQEAHSEHTEKNRANVTDDYGYGPWKLNLSIHLILAGNKTFTSKTHHHHKPYNRTSERSVIHGVDALAISKQGVQLHAYGPQRMIARTWAYVHISKGLQSLNSIDKLHSAVIVSHGSHELI